VRALVVVAELVGDAQDFFEGGEGAHDLAH
jgi:hypothetical protein